MSKVCLNSPLSKRYSSQNYTRRNPYINITPSPSNYHSDTIPLHNTDLHINQSTYTPIPISYLSIKRSTLNKNYITNTSIINYHVTKAKQYKPITFKYETIHSSSPSSRSARRKRVKRSNTSSPVAQSKLKTIQDFKLKGCKAELALPPIRAQSAEKRTRTYVVKSSNDKENKKIEPVPAISQEVILSVPEDVPILKCIRLKTRLNTVQPKRRNLTLNPTPSSAKYDTIHPRLKSPETLHEQHLGKIKHRIRLLSNRDIYLEPTEFYVTPNS